MPITQITLRALQGEPLADAAVRSMVLAAASAIAERHGIEVLKADAADDRVTVTLTTHRLGAIGFAAELRRLTTNWYTEKYGAATLWGEAPHVRERADDDDADWWKRA
jgi:hypothetical protein